MKRRILSVMLIVSMIFSVLPISTYAVESEPINPEAVELEKEVISTEEIDIAPNNLLKITNKEDFSKGTLDNLEIIEDIGNGAIRLTNEKTEGTFVSPVYTTPEFEYLVSSWNADTPEGTWVEVKARIFIVGTRDGTEQNDWTSWMSWGTWSPYILRGSTSDEDVEPGHGDDGWAYMDTDQIAVRGSSGAVKLQLMATLHRDSVQTDSPVLSQLSATMQNTNSGKFIDPTYAETTVVLPLSVELPTPAYSQMNRDPAIGDSICSPTTISIMLNDRKPELDLIPEEMALNLYDFNYGFGNWAYAVAGAGSYGYEAYVQFADFDIIEQELAKDNSVGISVRYRNKEDASDKTNPYLENGAAANTSGHLISITGYFDQGGKRYYRSSDSATSNEATTSGKNRIYEKEQLKAAWGKNGKYVAYIIPGKEPEENAGNFHTQRYETELTPVAGNEDQYSLMKNNQKTTLPEDFVQGKMSVSGRGTLAFTIDGIKTDMPDGVNTVTANNTFFYSDIAISSGGDIILPMSLIFKKNSIDIGESRDITVYAIGNDGKMYTARKTFKNIPTIIAAPMLDYANEQNDVAPADYFVNKEGSGGLIKLKVTAGGVQRYTNQQDALGNWVGAGVIVPEDIVLSNSKYYFGAEPFNGVYGDGDINDLLYTDAKSNKYIAFYADAGAKLPNTYFTVDWDGAGEAYTAVSYYLDLNEVIVKGKEIDKKDNNAFIISTSADFEQGSTENLDLLALGDGAITLKGDAIQGTFISPVYNTPVYEYVLANWGAITPGNSSVEVQMRVYAMRSSKWTEWMSWGKWGTGISSESGTYENADAALDVDSLTLYGSSSTDANSNQIQVRIILRGDKTNKPVLYQMSTTLKKTVTSTVEGGIVSHAEYMGEEINPLPDSVINPITPYSTDSHTSSISYWPYANNMFMALNGQGADLLYPEVALSTIDFADGVNNWAFCPSVVGKFGFPVYSQFDATPAVIQQVLAGGDIVVVNVNAKTVGATYSNAKHSIVIYGYETENQVVTFKCICPSGDVSELESGRMIFDCTAENLASGISGYSSTGARGNMYVIGKQEEALKAQAFKRTSASFRTNNNSEYKIYVNGNRISLPYNFLADVQTELGRGVIAYTIDGENAGVKKLADQDFYYDTVVNSAGNLQISDTLKAKILEGKKATVYVITNNGITYAGSISKYVAPSDDDPSTPAIGDSALKPDAVTDGSGLASITVSEDAIKNAISTANNDKKPIIITPEITGNPTVIDIEFSQDSIADMAKGLATSLMIKTDIATVNIPSIAMKSISEQTKDKLGIELKKNPNLAISVSIKSGSKEVLDISGGISVLIPTENATSGTVARLILADGSNKIIRKSIMSADGINVYIDGSATIEIIDNSQSFKDIQADSWMYNAVTFVASHEIFNGVKDDTFAPNDSFSKGMLVTVLNRLENEPKAKSPVQFSDVSADAYYANAIAWAVENGISNDADSTWEPNKDITREELAVIVYRYAKVLGYDIKSSATDIGTDVSSWATEAMTWAVSAGLLKGDTTGLNPTKVATRAQTATVLQRFMELTLTSK